MCLCVSVYHRYTHFNNVLYSTETLNHPLPDTLPPGEYCSCLRGHTLSVEDVSLEEITKQSNGVVPLDRDDNGTSDNTNDKSLLNNTQVHEDEKDGLL